MGGWLLSRNVINFRTLLMESLAAASFGGGVGSSTGAAGAQLVFCTIVGAAAVLAVGTIRASCPLSLTALLLLLLLLAVNNERTFSLRLFIFEHPSGEMKLAGMEIEWQEEHSYLVFS